MIVPEKRDSSREEAAKVNKRELVCSLAGACDVAGSLSCIGRGDSAVVASRCLAIRNVSLWRFVGAILAFAIGLFGPDPALAVQPDVQWERGTARSCLQIAPLAGGQLLAAMTGCGYDGILKIIRIADGLVLREVAAFPGSGGILGSPNGIAIVATPDGQTIAVTGQFLDAQGNLAGYATKLYRASDLTLIRTLNSFGTLSISPDGSILAVSHDLYRMSDGTLIATLPAQHSGGGAFSPDNQYVSVLLGYQDEGLYRISDGAIFNFASGAGGGVTFSVDGSTVVVADRVYSVASVIAGNTAPVITLGSTYTAPRFSPDGTKLVLSKLVQTFSQDGNTWWYQCQFKLFNTSNWSLLGSKTLEESCFTPFSFSSDGQSIFAPGTKISMYSAADASFIRNINDVVSSADGVWISPNGQLIAMTDTPIGANGNPTASVVRLLRVADGVLLRTLLHNNNCYGSQMQAEFSPDSSLLATTCRIGDSNGSYSSHIGEVKLWRVADGAVLNTFAIWANSVAFSPDGQTLAILEAADGYATSSKLDLIDVSSGTLVRSSSTLSGYTSAVPIVFSPDGRFLALGVSGNWNGVFLYRISDGTWRGPPGQFLGGDGTQAFSPDGSTLYSAISQSNGTTTPPPKVLAWRVADGAALPQNALDNPNVRLFGAMAFSPDRKYVFVVGDITYGGGPLRVWRLSDGALVKTYDQGIGTGVRSIALSNDGHWLAYGRKDATIVLARSPLNGAPAAFTLTSQIGAAPGSLVTSAPITVSGMDLGAPISIAGGSYSVNGGAFTSVPDTIINGDVVRVQLVAAAAGAVSTATLTIGGVSSNFNVTSSSQAPVADSQAPTIPGSPGGSVANVAQVNLNWQASTDDVGVTQYKVSRSTAGGAYTQVGTVSGTPPVTNFSDTAVAANTIYRYTVQACDAAANCSAPTLPVPVLTVSPSGPNFASVNIYRNRNTDGLSTNVSESFGFSLGYPRQPGDKLSTYAITCTGSSISATGNFAASPGSSQLEWHGIGWGSTPPATPISCSSTVTFSDGTPASTVPVIIDRFMPASAYAQGASLGFFQNVSTLPSINWTAASGYRYDWGVNNFNGPWVWGSGSLSPPANYAGPALTADTAYSFYLNANDGWYGNYTHWAGISIPFCYNCSGDTTPPTVPINVNTYPASATQVNVNWAASTDNVGTGYYKVYREKQLIGEPLNPNFTDINAVAGNVYHYTVTACDAAGNCSAQSMPAIALAVSQGGPNYGSVYIGRNQFQGSVGGALENFSFSLGYPRSLGDGLSSWSISCPGAATASGTFAAAPSSGTRWDYFNGPIWNTDAPAVPLTCTSTVTTSGGTSSSVPVTIDYWLPASAYPTNISPSYYQNVTAVPDASWTPSAGYTYTGWISPLSGIVTWNAPVAAAPPLIYSGSTLAANNAYIYNIQSRDSWGGNYTHAAQAYTAFCYQCAPDSVAPAVPGRLNVSVTTSTTLSPSWVASTDNIGVAYYKVYRNGVLIYEPRFPTTSFTDRGLVPGTSYTYTVSACDAKNNCSAQSISSSMTAPIPGAYPSMVSLNFPTALQGTTSAAQTVILTNYGTSALTVSNVSVIGDFALTANGCSTSVAANGGRCRITVSFAPTASGARSGTLTITSNAPNNPVTVTLSGTGGPTVSTAGNLWTRLGGPGYGGYLRTVATSPDGSYWAVALDGGIFMSQDGGATWQARNNGLTSLQVRNVSVNTDPSLNATGNTIATNLYELYAPTMGDGLFKSTDGGNTWSAINHGLNCTYVSNFTRVGGYAPAVLLAATECKTNSGIYYSTDAGASWSLASGLPTDVYVHSIARFGTPSGTTLPDFLLAMTDKGIYKSTDRGVSWVPTDASITIWGPNGHVAYSAASAYYSGSATQVVIVLVEGVGLFRSTDQGATWAQVTTGLPAGGMPTSSISTDGSGNWYVAVDSYGIYKSAASSAGTSWTVFINNAVLPEPRGISVQNDQYNGTATTAYFAWTYAGPYKSGDGVTWTKLGGPGLPGGYAINGAMDSAGNIYAAAANGVYKYNPATQVWSKLGGSNLGSVSGSHMIINGAGTIYTGTANMGVFLYDSVNNVWIAKNNGLPVDLGAQGPELRFDPVNTTGPGLWAGLNGQGVYYSADGGSNWTSKNGSGTGALIGDALKIRHMQIAPSGTAVLISTEAGIWRSTDSGASWNQVFLPTTAAGESTYVDHLTIDAAAGTPFTAYAAVLNANASGVSFVSNGIWRSSNGGATWTQLAGLAGKKVHEIKVGRPGGNLVLYAGVQDEDGSGGAYQSTDGGASFTPINTGLGSIYVNSFVLDGTGNLKYVATLGDGVYAFNPPSGPADVQAPSVPLGLTAAAVNSSQVNLLWSASTDNVGVTAYQVYRGGTLLATLGNVLSYSDAGVIASTRYSYAVAACDAAGNCSAQSTPVVLNTPPLSDTIAPSVPTGVTASAVSANQVNLTWTASTDNVGVTGYKVYRISVLVGSPAVTNYSDTGLTASTTYSYTVAACDAAGNCSASSASVSATTLAGVGGGTTANVIAGWNLLGNGMSNPITVSSLFSDSSLVSTVWKWIASSSAWAFYTPTLADGGAAYAAGKGYTLLTTINAGEGFWVNAKSGFSVQLSGNAVPTSSFAEGLTSNALPTGWSLIAIGDNKTPITFANTIAANPPAAGTTVATSLTTLWAWDATLTGWYFFAPSLVNAGTQSHYITSKGYLDFGTKTLTPTTGFWVNKP